MVTDSLLLFLQQIFVLNKRHKLVNSPFQKRS